MCEINEDLVVLDSNYKLIQTKDGFRFGTDTVILVDFFKKVPKTAKVLDIGAGNGIIPILLVMKGKAQNITGIEIQNSIATLAMRNIELNNMSMMIKIENLDIKKYPVGNKFDFVISNPPYMEIDGKKQGDNLSKIIARHEINLSLEQLIKNAKRVLKPVGSFTFVHRSHRFVEIVKNLEENGFCVKRVRFVYYSEEKNSNLVLIEATKGKRYKLEIEPPLYLNKTQKCDV